MARKAMWIVVLMVLLLALSVTVAFAASTSPKLQAGATDAPDQSISAFSGASAAPVIQAASGKMYGGGLKKSNKASGGHFCNKGDSAALSEAPAY